MHLTYWIKAKDDFPSKFALSLSGGYEKDGKFKFRNELQKAEYERIQIRLRKGEDIGKIAESYR